MNYLRADHLEEIEQILGARLTPELLSPVERPDALSPAAIDVVRKTAMQSRQLAVAYLREIVPNERISSLVAFLERVLERV
jgi:hypothetical protein